MKHTFKPLPTITPNNLNLMLGSSIGSNIDASLTHSKELLQTIERGSVLYINTVEGPRSRVESMKKNGVMGELYDLYMLDQRRMIYYLNCPRGEFHKIRPQIDSILAYGYIQYIVVNSWEFASRSSRQREESIFMMKDLLEGTADYPPMTLMVYAQEQSKIPKAQMVQRGGFGKLSGLAKRIESIVMHEEYYEEDTIGEISDLPEVKAMEIDPRIGTEDEPGISDDEAYDRFMAKIKRMSAEKIENEELRIENGEIKESVREKANSEMEVHMAPVFMPSSATKRSRKSKRPQVIDALHTPIHMNNFSPDRTPAPSAPSTPTPITRDLPPAQNVHSDVVHK